MKNILAFIFLATTVMFSQEGAVIGVIDTDGTLKKSVLYESGGANNDALTFSTLTDGYNYVAGDFTTGRLVKTHKGATDITVTVPSGTMPIGAKSMIKTKGTGTVTVVYGAGQDGIPFVVSDSTSTVTMVHYDYGGGDERIEPIGKYDVYNSVTLLSTDSNAANSDNESNATTGFGNVGGTLSSTATSPITGTYSILYERATSSGGERMTWTKAVTNGDEVRIRFNYIASSNSNMNNLQGAVEASLPITADGTQRVFDETITIDDAASFEIRWYPSTTGDWKIDDFIVEITN